MNKYSKRVLDWVTEELEYSDTFDLDMFAYFLIAQEGESRKYLCSVDGCDEEVVWIKGWYDCPYHGQLSEHPILDTGEDAND